MNLWAFRFLLWYICVLMVQPQNRFTFLWPLRIANLAFLIAVGLHFFSCLEGRRSLVRAGPATLLAFALMTFAVLSLHFGTFQTSSAWNAWVDVIVKNSLLLIMVEALALSVERVWAVQMTMLFCTLWWVKGGLRLSQMGATYSGDRLMGAAVSMIENPNGFAYMMCVFLPLYLYAYQRATKKWIKWFFLACALANIYIIFQTGSRTGLLTLIVMAAFLLPYYGKNHFRALAVIVVALFFIFPLTGKKNIERFRSIPKSIASFFSAGEEEQSGPMTQDEQSASDRSVKNRHTWGLIKEHLVFGIGVSPDERLIPERFENAGGQVHCEILAAGRQMGLIGMGLHVGFISIIFFGGWWVRRNAAHWPAVQDLGWTFQMQAVAFAVGGAFSPGPWNSVMMVLAGSVSGLVHALKEEQAAKMERLAGY